MGLDVNFTKPVVDQLFRQEVVDGRASRLHGEIILAHSNRAMWITGLLAATMVAASLWLTTGSYARTETARGVLVTTSGSAKVFALRPGVVSALMVMEGDLVRAGQKVAIVINEQPNAAGGNFSAEGKGALVAQEAIAGQQMGLSGMRASNEQRRLAATLDGLAGQRTSVAQQAALQAQIVASTRQTFEQLSTIVKSGYISKIEYERRRQAYIGARQELARLQQQLASLDADQARARAEMGRARLTAAAEINDVRSSVQGIRQQKARLEADGRYSVEAPVTGRVTAVQTAVGRMVGNNVPLLSIVPDGGGLRAEIYAPSRAIGFVQPKQEVRLLYDAFPYQRFGSFTGRVQSVSRTVLTPQEVDAPLKIEEPVYRVTTSLDDQSLRAFGEAVPLQPGMTFTANLVLDRRSFWDWLMLPFNAVSRRS